jgi:hypothetical protein
MGDCVVARNVTWLYLVRQFDKHMDILLHLGKGEGKGEGESDKVAAIRPGPSGVKPCYYARTRPE